MDKYTLGYKLRREGINGLTIEKRKLQETTIGPLMSEVTDEESDLRNYTRSGLIYPMEDYWVSGEGRPPIAIREVQTAVPGMKRYALLKEHDINPVKQKTKSNPRGKNKLKLTGMQNIAKYGIMYVYSEGIDFKKMAEDEEYAKVVISLLGEERLKQKQYESAELDSQTIYIGTVLKTETGYVKAGIRDYATAVTRIDLDIKKRQEEKEKIIKRRLAAERAHKRKKDVNDITLGFDREDWKEMMRKMMSECGLPETGKVLKEILKEIQNPEPTLPEEFSTYEDDEWEQ